MDNTVWVIAGFRFFVLLPWKPDFCLTEKIMRFIFLWSLERILNYINLAGDGRVVRRCFDITSPGRPTDIVTYSWARLAILASGKGRGEWFYFFGFFLFIPVPLSSLSLSFISSTISSFSFPPFSERRHKMTQKVWRVIKPQNNQSTYELGCM